MGHFANLPAFYFKDFRLLIDSGRVPESAYRNFPLDKLNETEYLNLYNTRVGDDFIRVYCVYTGMHHICGF